MDNNINIKKTKAEYSREWYLKNKEKQLLTMKKKKFCEACQCEVLVCAWNKHIKCKKHIKNLNNEVVLNEYPVNNDVVSVKTLTEKIEQLENRINELENKT